MNIAIGFLGSLVIATTSLLMENNKIILGNVVVCRDAHQVQALII